MERLALLFIAVLVCATEVSAADSRSASIYLDGAVIEQTTVAKKGYLEISLPASVAADSLRIRPTGSAEILRVITAPLKPGKGSDKEMEAIAAKEEQLHDRLKALSVKEDVFKAAAKSQSGKAPRRTKTNPEPMATIRQGTDYAMAQLESVYQSRRRTEKELATLLEKKNSVNKSISAAASVAKVWVSPANATVIASWIQADVNWTPEYQIRVESPGSAQLAVFIHANNAAIFSPKSFFMSNRQTPSAPILLTSGVVPALKVPLTITSLSGGDQGTPLTVTAVNSSPSTLPQGEVSCFQSGSYKGRGVLVKTEQAKAVEISCGGSWLK